MAQRVTPTDDELALRWIRTEQDDGHRWLYPNEWRIYDAGAWELCQNGTVQHRINAVIKAAKADGVRPNNARVSSVTAMAGFELWTDPDIFDQNPNLLVCQNGTLHMPSRQLRDHNPDDLITQRVNYDYDPDAQATVFEMAIQRAMDQNTIDFVQEFAGYCLTPDTRHEIAVWFSGPPGSGKSTLIEGFQAMGGDMVTTLGLAQIENSRFALGDLKGKRLAISTEQPGAYMKATSILNAIISGEEVIIERKFEDPLLFRPVTKVLWAMNQLPKVQSAGDGLFRRVKIVKFTGIPRNEQDPRIKEQIRTEGAGILNWALDGLDRLRSRGRFEVSKGVEVTTESFRLTADVPAAFVENCCELGPTYETQSSELYQAYKTWAESSGHRPQSITSIAEDWERLGLSREKRADANYIIGARLIFRS